jgi:ABC-type Fe3+ transport system permease subunit
MPDRIRCACSRCTIRGLMGPGIVITLGVLFLLSEMRGGMFDFSNTYPIILIVIGVISLACALAPMEGHMNGAVPPAPQVPPVPPAVTPGATPPFAGPAQGQ